MFKKNFHDEILNELDAGILLCQILLLCNLVFVEPIRRGHREVEDLSNFGPACRVYQPGRCAFLHKSGLPQEPFCHPGNGTHLSCNFDTKSLVSCPLALEGNALKKPLQHLQGHCLPSQNIIKDTRVPSKEKA